MLQHKVIWIVATVIGLAVLAGCTSSIPPASQFQIPAVGTPMPGGHEEAVKPDLSLDTSGVLFVNQTGVRVQVVVSSTIATIPIGEDFLFILPPGTYQVYLYQPNLAPLIHTETTTGGKLRYVYLTPRTPR
jgi:hypothetical protein